MRIALVGARGVPALYSGFETAFTEIGSRLVERGHSVTAYCRKGYGDATETEFNGIQKVYLPRLNLKVADTLSHTFLSLLHALAHRPDVLIVVNPANGPLCVIPRLARIPFAINVDGLEWKRGKWPWLGQRYFYFASWFCTKIAPAIIADSRGIQDFYKTQWNCESFFAAYGGYAEHSTRPQLLEDIGLVPNEYFVVVARLEPENNTDLIVRAFEKVDTDKTLAIVGSTNFKSAYLDNLKASVTDPRIRFLGGIYEQDKLTEVLCNSFAYIHGHMVGGTNPVLLRALGCGARVLYVDVGFNREVVGDAGIPVPLNEEGAREVFQSVSDGPNCTPEERAAARRRIEDEYTWDHITDRYEELCYQLSRGK